MNELKIEIETEEVPFLEHARQKKAVSDFFAQKLELRGELEVLSSRKRLLIKLCGFEPEFVIPSKKMKGPSVSAPKESVEGFLKKANTTRNELLEEDGFFTFTTKEQRKNLKDLLEGGLLNELFTVISLSFSKTMFWNSSKKRWIRIIREIYISFNGECLNFEYANVKASPFTEYKQESVILNQKERLNKIKSEIEEIEKQYNVKCLSKERLFEENSYLADFPVISAGFFDEKYLKLPERVLIQTLESNQRYFLFKNQNDELSNLFAACIEGERSPDVLLQIIEGNKRVLHSRLEDAAYYIKVDTKLDLLSHLEKTKKISFHKNAGPVFERVERMLEIAKKIAPENKNLELGVMLCKADLGTEMTQSFPELQGYIGAYYAELENRPKEVCDAISLQYKIGLEEEARGKSSLTLHLALIEKYEKLQSLLNAGEIPTSSRDPFGIRRDALALVKIIIEGELDVTLPFEGAFKEIVLDRLYFYLKAGFPLNIISYVIDLEKQKDELSILNIFKKVELLFGNQKSFAEFSRINKILTSKEAEQFEAISFNPDILQKEEKDMVLAFEKAQTLKETLDLAPLISDFFEKFLVIDAQNEVVTKNRIAILKRILLKFENFSKISS